MMKIKMLQRIAAEKELVSPKCKEKCERQWVRTARSETNANANHQSETHLNPRNDPNSKPDEDSNKKPVLRIETRIQKSSWSRTRI